jgi:cutinase
VSQRKCGCRRIQVSFTHGHPKPHDCPCLADINKYSQGAALAAATISGLSSTVRNQVVGTVLFGYTKNLQNSGQIPNYPSDRLKVFCNVGDLVCVGTLTITPAHLAYSPAAGSTAPQFLISKITAA